MLETSRIRAGVWEGVIAASEAPSLEVVHLGEVVPGLEIGPIEGGKWRVSLPIPAALLSEGVQSFILRAPGGAEVGSFAIICGQVLESDLRAEIDLLRAELDLLKRAFRQHCAASGM